MMPNGTHSHELAKTDEEKTSLLAAEEPDNSKTDLPEKTKKKRSRHILKSKERVWVVTISCFAASLATLIAGIAGGFNSPALVELSNGNLTIETQYISTDSILTSIFGSIELAGGIVGVLLSWPLCNTLGRQTSVTASSAPFLCGWLMISYSPQITRNRVVFLITILTGRCLTGLASGWGVFSAAIYLTEISSPTLKGFFGNFNMMFYCIGVLFTYSLGIKFGDFQFSYSHIAWIATGITILFQFLMLVAAYESPRWLFSQNMDYTATRVLETLRGKDYKVAEEIEEIKKNLAKSKTSFKEEFNSLKQRAAYHPFILVLILVVFQQFGGSTISLYYASQIFIEAGYSDENAQLATLITVGVVKLFFVVLSSFMVDCVGRRLLLVTSSIGTIISCLLLGTYFLVFEDDCANALDSPGCPSGLEYLAISSMALLNASQSIGWSTAGTVIVLELLPNQTRALGGSIVFAFLWLNALLITLLFPSFSALVTPKFAWWALAILMAISILFVICFVPESKGKSLEKVQEHFEDHNILACSCTSSCTFKKE